MIKVVISERTPNKQTMAFKCNENEDSQVSKLSDLQDYYFSI